MNWIDELITTSHISWETNKKYGQTKKLYYRGIMVTPDCGSNYVDSMIVEYVYMSLNPTWKVAIVISNYQGTKNVDIDLG